MNTIIHSARGLLVLSLFSVGLVAASLTQAAEPQFAGPRNTIPQTQARTRPQSQPFGQLRASKDEAATCSVVRVKHYGHPGKGFDRIERSDVPCGKSRLSVR